MPTPTEIIQMSASLQNDTQQSVYHNEACRPYLNMALGILQEEFELNDIPVTYETSAVIPVGVGVTLIAFEGTNPLLPSNLIEIKALWESDSGQDIWSPMDRRSFLPKGLDNIQVSKFGVWAWVNNAIQLPNSLQANDLKLDYIKSIFPPEITDNMMDTDLGIKFKNCKTYLGFMTAALCSMFIGENETRAEALQSEANGALLRSMGISTKAKQSIPFRRRPFRFRYKIRRGTVA